MQPTSNLESQLTVVVNAVVSGGPITKDLLDAIRPFVTKVREEASKNKHYGFEDAFGLFLRKMYFLNPQAYGGRIQSYFASRFRFKNVPAKLNKGDFTDALDDHFEFKFSFADYTTPCLNLVQIRLFQDIAGYYCVVSDVRNNFNTYVFRLTKAQMVEECAVMGATSAHGTKDAVANNMTKELRLSLPIDLSDTNFSRWAETYMDIDKTVQLNAEL